MRAPIRKVVVFAGAAAIATGVGVGVASRGGDSAAATRASADQRVGGPVAGGPGRFAPGSSRLGELADALGVSETDLRNALEDALPQPGSAPPPQDPHALAAALAAELGMTTDEVEHVLDELRPDGDHDGPPPDGTLPPDGSVPPGGAFPPGGSTAPDGGTAPDGSTPPDDGSTVPDATTTDTVLS